MKIFLTYRLKGKKVVAVAGTEANCLRNAEIIFNEAGYPNHWFHPEYRIMWANSVEKQKNYAGRSPLYKEI